MAILSSTGRQSTSQPKPLRIVVHCLEATGHVNACIGLALLLVSRGHKIYFLIDQAFEKQFVKYGFEEILLHRKKPDTRTATPVDTDPVLSFAKQLIGSGRLGSGRKSSLDRMKATAECPDEYNVFQSMFDACVDFNPQIGQILRQVKPHIIIVDHFFLCPAIRQSQIPFIMLFSGNPLPLFNSPHLPPPHSGFAIDSPPCTWNEFILVLRKQISRKAALQQKLNELFHYSGPLTTRSEHLNIYLYPEELDYRCPFDGTAGAVHWPNCIRVDAFFRETPELFQWPEEFCVSPNDKLIYVSLGSMGSIDVKLMKRIVSVLGKTPHKYIVSKGLRAAEYDLPPNCWGKANLPQTKILPLVDLVITHGGNNTVTEAFAFGKPMLVLPLFADQFDNAQRIFETGYGIRLEPYEFGENEMIDAIERLLADNDLHQRLRVAAERIAKSNCKELVCEEIEALGKSQVQVPETAVISAAGPLLANIARHSIAFLQDLIWKLWFI